MPKSQRSSFAELEDRHLVVRELIQKGANGSEVWEHIQKETKWGIGRTQAYNYYNAVLEQMADDATKVDRAAYFVRSLERLDYVYAKAAKAEDWKTARQVTMDVVSLLRLDTPDADYDWKKVAAQHGIKPADLLERMKRLVLEEGEATYADGQAN